MDETTVSLEVSEGVGWIRLDRPKQLNAFSRRLMDDLNEVLDRIDADKCCRVIVVTGNGRAFSAGGDLKEFKHFLDAGDHDGLVRLIDYTATTLTRLEESTKPVIAAVNGVAVAGGMEMLLCCDIVLAAQSAMLGDGHAKYGVLPGAGGATRLVHKIPFNSAARLLLTGELFPARHRVFNGLIDEVLPDELLLKRTADLARQMSRLSPLALGNIKAVAQEARNQPVSVGIKLELAAFQSYVGSADFAEGMAAFSERRTPTFLGR